MRRQTKKPIPLNNSIPLKPMSFGYCGNVHPGRTIDELQSNLERHALNVKSQVRPDQEMEIGLWLSATAARELEDETTLFRFRDWLAEKQLVPFTLNGFPFGDFHEPVVKHNVYLPTWAEPERLDYTVRLAKIISVLMPPGATRTISTLPLGWPVGDGSLPEDRSFLTECGRNLRRCAEQIEEIQQRTGDQIIICIEPEPGCVLDTWDDITRFFEQYVRVGDAVIDDRLREQIGVCHDICHSAVMFEEQATAVNEYSRAGIRIGKVQVSSAVDVDFEVEDGNREAILKQLSSFAEPKYLHQTMVRTSEGTTFYEDLEIAIAECNSEGQWRIHFHVPIYSPSLGLIGTTQSEIAKCIEAIELLPGPMPHFEIETYAWNVLPDRLKEDTLADGIAKEMIWLDELFLP